MAILLVTKIERFVGLSGDGKPASPPAGSRFYETNTNKDYIFNGSTWVQYYPLGGEVWL